MSEEETRRDAGTGWATLTAVLAWIVPGLGHFVQARRARALVFCIVILVSFVVGCALQGNLYTPVGGQPLTLLATLGAMGAGAPYFAARWLLGYSGSPEAAGYEYGTAFLLSAGLMNLLLVLDAWDIARGKKD